MILWMARKTHCTTCDRKQQRARFRLHDLTFCKSNPGCPAALSAWLSNVALRLGRKRCGDWWSEWGDEIRMDWWKKTEKTYFFDTMLTEEAKFFQFVFFPVFERCWPRSVLEPRFLYVFSVCSDFSISSVVFQFFSVLGVIDWMKGWSRRGEANDGVKQPMRSWESRPSRLKMLTNEDISMLAGGSGRVCDHKHIYIYTCILYIYTYVIICMYLLIYLYIYMRYIICKRYDR